MTPEAPARMTYCGMELKLDDSARSYIDGVIKQITRSPNYFKSLVEQAEIYLPIVDEAFTYSEVPLDLKYIVIQESAFRADAVSSSNAVGYWQFKEAAAREVGLVMNSQMDERMHIFRSSMGAARYFFRLNRDFDNWVYAVIAYNRGPAGAIPFTNPAYFGKREMPITGKETHWYALKALAYKLMFQDEMGKYNPGKWLEPRTTNGETSLQALAQANGTDVETLKKYNKWIRGNQVPDQADLIYYVPREGAPVLAQMRHIRDGIDRPQIGSKEPVKPPVAPKPVPTRNTQKFDYLSLTEDPAYGVEYVAAQEGQSLVEIAVAHGVKTNKLRDWNNYDPSYTLETGEIVYLKPALKVKYHVVVKGETLVQIAEKHGTTLEKLKAKNHLKDNQVYAGQKLHLRKAKPKGEKPTILELPDLKEAVVEAPKPVPASSPKENLKTPTPEVKPASKPVAATGKTHTVASGDTLWNISKRYGTTVDAIKRLNNMRSESLYVGQKLRIPGN